MTYFFNAEDIFHTAIMIEQNGERFYKHLQVTLKDEKAVAVCARLAREEHIHMLMFEQLLGNVVMKKGGVLNQNDFPEDDFSYLKALSDSNVFASALNIKSFSVKIHSVKDAINIALGFEKDSVFFFIQMKKFTRPEWGQSDIDKLIEQEQRHIQILTLLLEEMK